MRGFCGQSIRIRWNTDDALVQHACFGRYENASLPQMGIGMQIPREQLDTSPALLSGDGNPQTACTGPMDDIWWPGRRLSALQVHCMDTIIGEVSDVWEFNGERKGKSIFPISSTLI